MKFKGGSLPHPNFLLRKAHPEKNPRSKLKRRDCRVDIGFIYDHIAIDQGELR